MKKTIVDEKELMKKIKEYVKRVLKQLWSIESIKYMFYGFVLGLLCSIFFC